jgi:hypothetical protein
MQLGVTASTFIIDFLERFQSKVLRMIVDTPWYVPNTALSIVRASVHTQTTQ